MVDYEQSSSPSYHADRSQAPSPRPQKSRSRAKLLLLAGLPLVLFGIVLAALLGEHSAESEIVVDNKLHTIQLDVLNGAGESKLAQRMTDFLRAKGFDVVEIGNYAGELQQTLVIDRIGKREAAVQVARSIGVPEERVIEKIDKTLYLDVSVYIGKDFPSLRPFQ